MYHSQVSLTCITHRYHSQVCITHMYRHVSPCVTDSCDGTSFGKKAANAWSNLMQKAEGPEAFMHGYILMRRMLANDEARLEYLEELLSDVNKAHFKADLPFCNGVLVDMCETLFGAVKTWVNGRCKNTRVTLLMAFVRICHGVYSMVTAGFLSPIADALKKTVSLNPQVSSMFRIFCKKLTTRAVTDMFKSLQRKWGSYKVTSLMDLSVKLVSSQGDVFVVDEDFCCKCKADDGRMTSCWQQSHSGLLCNHALRACVQFLKETEDSDDRDEIIENAVEVCDKNWLRSTYRSKSTTGTQLPQPVPLTSSVSGTERDLRWTQYVTRFRDIMRFLSPQEVETHLFSMEKLALSDRDREDTLETTDETSTGEVSDESSSVVSVTLSTHSSVVSGRSSTTQSSSAMSTSSSRSTTSKRDRSRVLFSNPVRRRRRRYNNSTISNAHNEI